MEENKYKFTREEVLHVFSKHVPGEHFENFIRQHETQVSALQNGKLSGVSTGFQKKAGPTQTYDARIKLSRQKQEAGWSLIFETGNKKLTHALIRCIAPSGLIRLTRKKMKNPNR